MKNSLNIVTYNIHNGRKEDEIIKNLAEFAAQGVSIFCLQEIRQNSGKEFIVNKILSRLGSHWQAECFIKPGSFDLGICTLWNNQTLNAVNFESLHLPKISRLALHEKIIERFINKHKKFKPLERAALSGVFEFHDKLIRITNAHLDWHGGFKQRGMQLHFIKEFLNPKVNINFEILCGDFNTLGFYRFNKKLSKKISPFLDINFKNAFEDKKVRTFLWQKLDHIYVKNLTVVKSEAVKYKGSDHFPLLAEVQI